MLSGKCFDKTKFLFQIKQKFLLKHGNVTIIIFSRIQERGEVCLLSMNRREGIASVSRSVNAVFLLLCLLKFRKKEVSVAAVKLNEGRSKARGRKVD